MKRWHFLAALFGFGVTAKAQVPGKSASNSMFPKPNNECPLCGTLADPWRSSVAQGLMPGKLVRCKHCNVAFWQDAEPQEKL